MTGFLILGIIPKDVTRIVPGTSEVTTNHIQYLILIIGSALMDMRLGNSYLSLPERFYQKINPEPSLNPQLLFWNDSLAQELNLNIKETSNQTLSQIFSGNLVLENSQPIALAYAGHQFGYFVPKLGDGRAHLIGEIKDKHGMTHDVQLKGSGTTEFSRRGDGRSPLASVLKEFVISEAMHCLGIPTTRSLAAVETANNVIRNGVEKSGILTRIASSHVRIGTFEYFHHRKDFDAIKILADYVINRHFNELLTAENSPNKYELLFTEIVKRQASLVAKWLNVGFVHGVLNTDNTSIVGETLDYGPCAFIDDYDVNATYSSIDSSGRYSYTNQVAAMQWNLEQLARCFTPLVAESKVTVLLDTVSDFGTWFYQDWYEGLRLKLGIDPTVEIKLVQNLFEIMQINKLDYNFVFRQLAKKIAAKEFTEDPNSKYQVLDQWFATWQNAIAQQNQPVEQIQKSMLVNNPAIIPRNFIVQQAIDEYLIRNDVSMLQQVISIVSDPYSAAQENSLLDVLPTESQKSFVTFCGT